MYKIILAATILTATSYASLAREVCRDVEVQQVNCRTVNGKKTCDVSHETAKICHEEPDTPKNSAAAGRADQLMQSDNETNWAPERGSSLKNKQVLFVQ